MWTWKRCVYSYYFECNVLKISINFNCSIVSFRISTASLILSGRSAHGFELDIKVSYYDCIPGNFSLYIFYVFECFYGRCIYVDEYKIFFLCWSLYHCIMSFYIFLYGLCFKVYFVWYEYCAPSFLFISIRMKYLFLSSHFQSMSVLCPRVGLLQAQYCRLFFKKSNLCLLIGAFSPLKFEVIIDCHFCFPIDFTFLLCLFPFVVWFSSVLYWFSLLFVFSESIVCFELWLPCFSSMLTPSNLWLH